MGELIGGEWHVNGIETVTAGGRLRRPPSVFRDWVTADGSAAPAASSRASARPRKAFKAERGRYHLYVSLACPWAHRALILRSLKGLEDVIGLSVVHWLMGDEGWTFEPGPGVVPDTVNGQDTLHGVYTRADRACTSRVTVPVLWDKEQGTIVSNESSEIIRMLNSEFDHIGARPGDHYPAEHRQEIDAVNDRIYSGLNNGVYMAGFATDQAAYEDALAGVFDTLDWLEGRLTLDWLEGRLSHRGSLVGPSLTEADIRLFTTLVRFDAAYHGHFKCNRQMLIEFPNLWNYTRSLFQHPDIRPTVAFNHIKRHYYMSHPWLNPTRIVPSGPLRDFDAVVL